MNNQQPKPDPKGKAIASFVLGIISVILTVLATLFLYTDITIPLIENGETDYTSAMIIIFTIILPIGIIGALTGFIGLILGIRGLRSSKRIFAIIGLVLSGMALLIFIGVLTNLFWPFRSSVSPAPPSRY